MKTGNLPPETSFDDVQLKIREAYRNPNVRYVSQAVLKDGPIVFKIATVFEIVDPKTDQFHHHSLRIDHIDRRKDGWFAKPEKSVRLESQPVDEIERLNRFLTTLVEGRLSGKSGDLRIIDSTDYENLANVVEALGSLASHDKLELVKAILSRFDGPGPTLSEFVATFEASDPDVLRTISVASRLVECESACERLGNLCTTPSRGWCREVGMGRLAVVIPT